MTIIAGAACPEGLVVAGDSRSSVEGKAGLRTTTDYAQKVFTIDGRFVAATFGWATLEGKTISGHARDFDDQVTINGDVNDAATELRDYFSARVQAHIANGWDKAPPPGREPMGFMLAGYDAAGVGHVMQVWPYSGAMHDFCQTNNPGGVWNGEPDVMTRLVKGYDMTRIDASKWGVRRQKSLTNVEYITNFGWFSLQDAIDWTVYVARTTIDTQRFTNGTVGKPGSVPTCGGTIELATVTYGDEVRWIRKTDLRG